MVFRGVSLVSLLLCSFPCRILTSFSFLASFQLVNLPPPKPLQPTLLADSPPSPPTLPSLPPSPTLTSLPTRTNTPTNPLPLPPLLISHRDSPSRTSLPCLPLLPVDFTTEARILFREPATTTRTSTIRGSRRWKRWERERSVRFGRLGIGRME